MRILGHLFSWCYWYPVRYITRILPRSRVAALGSLIGSLHYMVRKRKRQIVKDEIATILPSSVTDDSIRSVVRNSFRQAATVALETFCFPRINTGNINQWMRIHGINHLHHALGRQKGVVVVLAHFGANQMVMAALGYRGYPVIQIGSHPQDWHRLAGIKPTRFENHIFELRLALEKSLPARFVYISKSMRPIYDALRNNQIMMMTADGRAGTRFFSVPFKSRIMNVSSGPFRLAESTGAALIPAFPVTDVDGIHDLYIEAPVQPETHNGRTWAEEAARMYGEKLAEWVSMRPDHYAMLMAEARVRSSADPVPLFEDFRHGH